MKEDCKMEIEKIISRVELSKEKKDSIADKVEKQKELKGFNVKFNK
jgi:hypothetical protein